MSRITRVPTKRLLALGIGVIFSFSAISVTILWQMAQKDFRIAEKASANLVASIASEIERNIELYDLSLQAVVDGVNLPTIAQVSPELRQVILFDRAATAKDLGSIQVLDRDGNVTLDSRDIRPRQANFADRDFFQVHEARRDVGLFLSQPWVTSKGEYLISLSRRIDGPDGSFRGVVAGSMRLSYFHNLFRKLNFGSQDTMTLFNANGLILMRAPFEIDRIGQSLRSSITFRYFPRLSSGSYTSRSLIDGVTRLYVFQQVGAHPLVLTEGLSLEGIYADWWHMVGWIGTIMAALTAFSTVLMFNLVAALNRRAAAERKLAVLASTDGLTGLANRRHFDRRLADEWRRGVRSRAPISLLMIDVDHFKKYNDTHGHQAGDQTLQTVARCIARTARRASDLSARYGGEEFTVLLPSVSKEQAIDIAEGIRAELGRARGAQPNLPTVSIGLACIIPGEGLTEADLVRMADQALYRAKRCGRDRFCIGLSGATELANSRAA